MKKGHRRSSENQVPRACRLAGATAIITVSLFVATLGLGASLAQGAAAPPLQAASQTVSLPDTSAGRTLRAFLTAFNTGDIEALKRFHREHGGDEANAQEDLGFFRQSGGLKLHSVAQSGDYEIEVVVQAIKGNDWLKFSIEIDHASPHGIVGVRVQPTSAPSTGGPTGSTPPAPPADISPSAAGKVTTAAPPNRLSLPESLSELEGYLKKRVADDQFSGVVLIAKDGKPVFQQAYGLANRQSNFPNRIDTKFNLGSINKIFTRIAVSQLVEQRRISPGDTIAKHLPDYPNKQAAEKVTIQHLLEMQSGIGDFFGAKFEATPKDRLRTIKDYLPLFASEPLGFEPGSRRAYSNGGYIVLGAIIEKVTGETYYDYVRTHIFKPAGMEATDSYEVDQDVSNLATGYTLEARNSNGRRVSNVYTKPARGSSAGGGYSTAPDLLRFAIALEGDKLLAADGTKGVLRGGLGIAGGAPGINATLELAPERGYTVIVLSNYDPPSAVEVNKQIRALLGMGN